MEKPRVRFAPSPTGQVHIGNIRTAIFNWLFARHEKGEFLLRIEDTDAERSTPEAIGTLLECMEWLGLDYDAEAMYQSRRMPAHSQAAAGLMADGMAYKAPGEDDKSPVLFRFPWDCSQLPFVREAGNVEMAVHPEVPVNIGPCGINYAQISKKGKPVPVAACLAGFRNLKLFDSDGKCVFELENEIDSVLAGDVREFEKCAGMTFTRREVFFNDIIKGELSKPLDGMKDLVILRSDGSPVFHLANVCDDNAQEITHIIRGDDHVENTYRHLFLFAALGYDIPSYAHLPMIVNQSGKPYSKRDGDAFVGEFREKGFLPEALFNALALLGWSPGDDREKLSRGEMIDSFTLERVKSAPAQFDIDKLKNLNAMYLAGMPADDFVSAAGEYARKFEWISAAGEGYFGKVAELMQSRTKVMTDIETWKYFFSDDFEYDPKALRKAFKNENAITGLEKLRDLLNPESSGLCSSGMEAAIREAEKTSDIQEGHLNYPLRVALSGSSSGADLIETALLLGGKKIMERIAAVLEAVRNSGEA